MNFVRLLNPKNDFLFKKIFGSEQNKDVLISFLNAVLCRTDDIVDIDYVQTIKDGPTKWLKQSIVDVCCKTKEGIQFIVEMQMGRSKGFEKRALFYTAKAYVDQMHIGGQYEHLQQVYLIAICDFILFPDNDRWKSTNRLKDTDTNVELTDAITLTFLEPSKFKHELHDLTTIEEKWLYFFKHAERLTREEYESLLQDPVFRKALEIMNIATLTEADYAEYSAAAKAQMDNAAVQDYALEEAERKGLEKGMQQGMQQKQIDLTLGVIREGLSIDLISKLTGLSAEEITGLK